MKKLKRKKQDKPSVELSNTKQEKLESKTGKLLVKKNQEIKVIKILGGYYNWSASIVLTFIWHFLAIVFYDQIKYMIARINDPNAKFLTTDRLDSDSCEYQENYYNYGINSLLMLIIFVPLSIFSLKKLFDNISPEGIVNYRKRYLLWENFIGNDIDTIKADIKLLKEHRETLKNISKYGTMLGGLYGMVFALIQLEINATRYANYENLKRPPISTNYFGNYAIPLAGSMLLPSLAISMSQEQLELLNKKSLASLNDLISNLTSQEIKWESYGEPREISTYFYLNSPKKLFIKVEKNTTSEIINELFIRDLAYIIKETLSLPIIYLDKSSIYINSGIPIMENKLTDAKAVLQQRLIFRHESKINTLEKHRQLNLLSSSLGYLEWFYDEVNINNLPVIQFVLHVSNEIQCNKLLEELYKLFNQGNETQMNNIKTKNGYIYVLNCNIADPTALNVSCNILATYKTVIQPVNSVDISDNNVPNKAEPVRITDWLTPRSWLSWTSKRVSNFFSSEINRDQINQDKTTVTAKTTLTRVKWQNPKHQNLFEQLPEAFKQLENYPGGNIYIFFNERKLSGNIPDHLYDNFKNNEFGFIGYGKTPGKKGFKFDDKDEKVIRLKNPTSSRPEGEKVAFGADGEILYEINRYKNK